MNGWDKLNENIKRILDKINIKSPFSLKPLFGILECEKYLAKDSLLYYHGHIYKVERIGIIKSGRSDYEHGALVIDVLNASNNRVLSFRHLSGGDFYLIKLDERKRIRGQLNEEKIDKIIAYHGSQTSKLKMYKNTAMYFTTNYTQAKSYAKREWDEGLIEGQIPVVYKVELNIKNPYYIKNEDDFMMDFTDTGMNDYFREELIEKGYDSAIYIDKKHNTKLIAIFYPSQYKILEMEKLPPSLEYYYNGELSDEDDINDYYYEDELDEVFKRASIQLNEEKNGVSFQIPAAIEDNFKITNSLKDARKWKAKIVENNSNIDESIGIGDWDDIGYVMISLADNTIIPIARSDEHRAGYEVLHDIYKEKYNINSSNYYSVFCLEGSANYPYNLEEAELLKQALIKCKSYGMDLTKSRVYMSIINSMYKKTPYEDSFITAEDFINGNFPTEEKANTQITNLGQKLVKSFKMLSESFSTTNIRGKYSIANINKAIKNLYNIGSKITLKGNFKFISDIDLEQMRDCVQQYKEGYYSNSQIAKAFFGFLGFRNNFHQRLRKNIDNKMLEKQLGSIKAIIDIIGNI